MSSNIETKISELIKWQSKQFSALAPEIYLNEKNGLRKSVFEGPYSDWDKDEVLHKEISSHIETMNELSRQLQGFSKSQILICILSLKNRIEYASGQSDNQTTFLALSSFGFTVFSRTPYLFLQERIASAISWVFLSIALGLVFYLGSARIDTRRKAAQYKKLINSLEFYVAHHQNA